jgi:hypothetical protein
MTEKMGVNKKENNTKTNNDVLLLVEKKIDFFKDVIQKTIIHVQKNKFLDILGISDVSVCIEKLGELSKKIKELSELSEIKNNTDNLINSLQLINNEMSSLLKSYGTDSLEDLLLVCFGNNNKITTNENESDKLELLKKYFHPTSYKVVNKKDELNQKKSDDIDENANLLCTDVSFSYKQFHMKVYGIKLFIHSSILKKSLIIFGIVDDIVIDFLNNKYVTIKKQRIFENLPQEESFQKDSFDKFMSSLTIKDYLIYDNEHDMDTLHRIII